MIYILSLEDKIHKIEKFNPRARYADTLCDSKMRIKKILKEDELENYPKCKKCFAEDKSE